MPYLIDSDVLIAQREAQPDALAVLEQLAPQGLAISIVTYMEVYQGTLRSPDPERARASLATFLAGVPVIPFSLAAARRCAELRRSWPAAASGYGRAPSIWSRRRLRWSTATLSSHIIAATTRTSRSSRSISPVELPKPEREHNHVPSWSDDALLGEILFPDGAALVRLHQSEETYRGRNRAEFITLSQPAGTHSYVHARPIRNAGNHCDRRLGRAGPHSTNSRRSSRWARPRTYSSSKRRPLRMSRISCSYPPLSSLGIVAVAT
jgi:predicted nucleic acid-binding protein